jgi:hypothetical protein
MAEKTPLLATHRDRLRAQKTAAKQANLAAAEMRQSCMHIRQRCLSRRPRDALMESVASDAAGCYASLLPLRQYIDFASLLEAAAKRREGQFGGQISWRKCHKTFENVCASLDSNLPSRRNPY